MTVGELIAELQRFDNDKIVYTEYEPCGDLTTIGALHPISSANPSVYEGHVYIALKEDD